MKNLIQDIKDNNQDYEFYPTTQSMVDIIVDKINQDSHYFTIKSILDIGAGDGNFFKKIKNLKYDAEYYAIEKSEILYSQLPSNITLVGCDFNENTLYDKEVDLVFCNPPYSQYEEWTARIIKETTANRIALIIPQRWRDTDLVKLAEKMKYKIDSLGFDDFLDAERQARAKVEIVYLHRHTTIDPFAEFLKESFNLDNKQKEEDSIKEKLEKNEVVAGVNLIERLVELYFIDKNKFVKNIEAICSLSAETLKSIGLDQVKITNTFKAGLESLKRKYWNFLVNNLDKITNRITSTYRRYFISKINANNVGVDFNLNNCYAIVLWIIKNCHQYYDRQLLYFYKEFSSAENVKPYKSNIKVFDNEKARYTNLSDYDKTKDENKSKLLNKTTLDYRIVVENYKHKIDYINEYREDEKQKIFINDLQIIANNLGFTDTIGEFKFYKNNNCHIKFNQEFLKRFNIEAGLLLGWIKDKQEAKQELNLKDEDLNYNKFTINNKLLLQ